MIYPPELGQAAGHNVWKAMGGFLLTERRTAAFGYYRHRINGQRRERTCR
ncbi:branched-chain amino acid transport system II carrier protein [Bacillus velezensis]